MSIETQRLLDEREAAAFLGLSRHTLNRWRVERRGPTFIRVGRRVKYAAAALSAYIESCAVPTADQPAAVRGGKPA